MKLLDLFKEGKETPPSTLYHFTTPENFVKIINKNTLKAHPKTKHISFTEDPDLWAFQEFPDSNQEIGVRMSFNTNSLPPVESFVYQDGPGQFLYQEKEWRTTTGDITKIEERILTYNTLEILALKYWKEFLTENVPGHLSFKINYI